MSDPIAILAMFLVLVMVFNAGFICGAIWNSGR